MIEAVNSVVANAPVLRGNAEAAAARALAAKADNTPIAAAPQAPYLSLYVHMDVDHDMAVLQIRDSSTGDVQGTIPSDSGLETRSRARAEASQLRVSAVKAQDIEFTAPQQQSAAPQVAIAALSTGSRIGVSMPGAQSGVGLSITA